MRIVLLRLLALCAFLLTSRSGDHPARAVLAFAQPFHDLFHPGEGLDTLKSSLDEVRRTPGVRDRLPCPLSCSCSAFRLPSSPS